MAGQLDAWLAKVHRRPLDIDGAYGAQCWDLWAHYAVHVAGVPYLATVTRAGGSSPHGGWACNVWHNAERAGLAPYFDKLGAKTVARRGDVAFWEKSPRQYPGSHVAIVIADEGAQLLTLTQNPGPPIYARLPKTTLLGYLRPRSKANAPRPTTPNPTPTREDDDVALTPEQARALAFIDDRREPIERLLRFYEPRLEKVDLSFYQLAQLHADRALRADGELDDVDPQALAQAVVEALPAALAGDVAAAIGRLLQAGVDAEAAR